MASPLIATQACEPCRRLKRKCTKELPACKLCVRLRKRCSYIDGAERNNSVTEAEHPLFGGVYGLQTRSHMVFDASRLPRDPVLNPYGTPLKTCSANLQSLNAVNPAFPELYFLDSRSFSKNPPEKLDSNLAVPAEVQNLLLLDSTERIFASYFLEIHPWLPMLSGKRLQQELESLDAMRHSSLSLLLLCMKLVIEPPTPAGRPESLEPYNTAVSFISHLELTRHISLRLLQSIILVGLFEIGHGIFPTGYLRIGHAARMGILMGLHNRKNASQLFKPSDTLTLREEERRTWWAIVVLDRYVNLGTNGLVFAAPDPLQGELLPCSDRSWNDGVIPTNQPLFSSTLLDGKDLGQFANACQAGHILGQVLRHRDDSENRADASFRLLEALSLHRTLKALDTHLQERYYSNSDPSVISLENGAAILASALCCSARLILYGMYGCNEPDPISSNQQRMIEETEMQRIAINGIREAAVERTTQIIQQVQELVGAAPQLLETSPSALAQKALVPSFMISYCIYHAASECAWLAREHPDQIYSQTVRMYVETLKWIGKQWQVTNLYLKLLQHEGVMDLLSQ